MSVPSLTRKVIYNEGINGEDAAEHAATNGAEKQGKGATAAAA